MSARGLMGKHKNTWLFMFAGLTGNGFLSVSMLNVTFFDAYLSCFCANSLIYDKLILRIATLMYAIIIMMRNMVQKMFSLGGLTKSV